LAARLFAQALNCETSQSDPCGKCSTCDRIERSLDPETSLHPDIMHLAPGRWEKQASHTILIDAVRDLCGRLYSSPLEARFRIVYVHEADTMQVAAQNAFLKTLEEPLERLRTVFVLISDRPHMLLSTIRSRCQEVGFSQISLPRLETYLVEHSGIDAETASRAAAQSDGNLNLALELARIGGDDETFSEIDGWLSAWEGLVNGEDLQPDNAISSLSRGREEFERVLLALIGWHRDLLVMTQGGDPSSVINRDRLPQLKRQAAALESRQVIWRIERLSEIRDFQAVYARADLSLAAMVQQIMAGEDLRG
jgi:DNA polymerase-3 subunit delta'